MTKCLCDEGTIVINGVTSLISFDVTTEYDIDNELHSGKLSFFGHISHAVRTAELMHALRDAWLPLDNDHMFMVAGQFGNYENGVGKVTCRNCFFTGIMLPPSGKIDDFVPCDLTFDVRNPDDDVIFEY